jgi:signal transduction histidine kinase
MTDEHHRSALPGPLPSELYRAFIDAAPQFIALARLDGSVLHVNPGGRVLAGIPDDVDVTTTTIQDYLTAEGLVASIEIEQPAVVRDGRWVGETTLRYWPTGEGIPVQVSSFLVTDPATGAPIALATVQFDIREVVEARKLTQRQVAHQRGLLVHLHEAQEGERQRIAGDIHDDTVQVMAGVNIRLQSLRRALDPLLPPERVAELDGLDRSVREATARLRRLMVDLEPPVAAGDDIAQAMQDTVAAAFVGTSPRTTLDVQVDTEPSPIVGRVLLRIAREALTNVRKHAEADAVRVEVRELPGEYLLRVLDDGHGIAAGDHAAGPLHRGLRSMRERADSVGGTATVTTRPEGGTLVEARLPHLLGHPEQALAGSSPQLFLEQVMESLTEGYVALDADWRYVFMNRAGYALLERDPADPVIGKVIWDEFDVPPVFEEAYRRARAEQVPVEVTGYAPEWDRWVHNRVLPTAGGLSVFARNVTAEHRAAERAGYDERLVAVGRAVLSAVISGRDEPSALLAGAEALAAGWPLDGVRVTGPSGVDVTAGDVTGGPVRRMPLQVSGRAVGSVDLVGEQEPVDDDLLQVFALRLAAEESTDRDDGGGVEPLGDK